MSTKSNYFAVRGYKVTSERDRSGSRVEASVEVTVGAETIRHRASGTGPVHALDNALRACLARDFPELERVQLRDYKVGVVDAGDGTAAHVCVTIQASDGRQTWTAECVSQNIVDASFEALCSSALIGIMRARTTELFSHSYSEVSQRASRSA